jgi:hypothetical protein
LHGPVEIVGIAARPDGSEAARFADTVNAEDGLYRHQFTIGPGNYIFRMEAGAGVSALKKEVPFTVDAWNSTSFGIGGIALSTDAHAAQGPASTGSLIAGGKEFLPSAAESFPKSGRVYLYTEVYEPTLTAANPSALTMQIRVVDRATGEVKQDTGMAGVAGYIRQGNPVVPFATALPLGQLMPGAYRLEVRAGHSSGSDIVTRAVDFEVN